MFRRLFEQISDFIMVTDFEGKFLDVNESMCRRFGYTKSELLEMYSRDLIEKKNLEEVPMQFNGLAKGDEIIRERRMVCKDGSIIEVEVNLWRIDDNRIFAIARDISERRKTEALIQQSEANLRSIIDSSDINYVLVDKRFNIIVVNALAKRNSKLIYGSAFEVGKNVLDYIPDLRKTIGKATMKRALSGEVITEEREFKLSDGSILYINLKEFPIENEKGEITGICISATDITKQKKIEKELREAEVKFRSLVEKSPSGIYIIQDGTLVYVNPTFAEVLGYTPEEIMGKLSVTDVIDENYHALVLENIRKRLAGEIESVNYELKGKRKNGELMWGEVYGAITTYNGKPAIIGTLLDITERKNYEIELKLSEEKYRLLFYSNPLPMWMVSYPEMQIIDVNGAAVTHYGYSKEEFVKMYAIELHPKDEYERFNGLTQIDWAGSNQLGTWKHKKKNGDIIYVEVTTHGLIFENKKIGLVYGNDITSIIKAKTDLQQMNNQLRRFSAYVQKAREDERKYVAQEIHDELGQLLTGIKMDMSWLKKRIESKQNELTGRVEKTIELTDRTIESVRKIATKLRPGILDDLGLEEAIRWLANELQNQSNIAFNIESNLGSTFFSPEISIAAFRILQESFTNIVRHSKAKTVTVKMNADKSQLYLEVADDGIGLAHAAARFGKSLGIMGMTERASMVNGILNITSNPGKGTIVKVTIPLKKKSESNGQ